MVLMECYQGKKVVSVEVFIMVTPDSEWIRSWQGYITWSPLDLRCDVCMSDQIALLIVSLDKGSKDDNLAELWTLIILSIGEVERFK